MSEPDAAQHFTYIVPNGDLCQGDILEKDKISKIIEEVHPHYLKGDYTHFLVLTQSCDLVRGRGSSGCKTRYVSIAAVRPLSLVLERELEKVITPLEKKAGVVSNRHNPRLADVLRKIYDNNHPEYFYLHEDGKLGFHTRSCCFLRLSIALKSDLHYEALVGARTGALNDVFRAKLGWNVGNLYSRVGTPDWVPDTLPDADFKEMIEEQLNSLFTWVEPDKLAQANKSKELPDINATDAKILREYISNQVVISKAENLLNAIKDVLVRENYTNAQVAEEISNILRNRAEFKSIQK